MVIVRYGWADGWVSGWASVPFFLSLSLSLSLFIYLSIYLSHFFFSSSFMGFLLYYCFTWIQLFTSYKYKLISLPVLSLLQPYTTPNITTSTHSMLFAITLLTIPNITSISTHTQILRFFINILPT